MKPTASVDAISRTGRKFSGDFLVWWLAPILLALLILAVWSNHFGNGFHDEDFQTIVHNRAVGNLARIPAFFSNPRTFSSEPEFADYRPLLSTSFAFDAALAKTINPVVFQVDSFVWFGILIGCLYLAFRVIPGTSQSLAVFAAALFALHPIAAETVNYISKRGQIMGAVGVCLAFTAWVVWPRKMPRTLGLNLSRKTQSSREKARRANAMEWEAYYQIFLKLNIPFHLLALIPALLCDPSAAALLPIVVAYVFIFDLHGGFRRLLPMGIVCVGYWLVQTLVVRIASPLFRVPAFTYWFSQPWVAMRYLFRFLLPVNLSADTDFAPSGIILFAVAVAGILGVGGLVFLAIQARRREEWRGVAFGICWFLAALLPVALVPQGTVEAYPRMFLAGAGLAFAAAHAGKVLFDRLPGLLAEGLHITGLQIKGLQIKGVQIKGVQDEDARRQIGLSACGVLALLALGICGWLTHERNAVWETERTLWLDVTEKSPRNPRGLVNYAVALAAAGEYGASLQYLQKAAGVSSVDGALELRMARGFDRLNRDREAEFHARRAMEVAPKYSAAYSWLGQWLWVHKRGQEAFDLSSRGLALNPADLISRHTLLDIYSERSDWTTVAKIAREAMNFDPDDPDAKRSAVIALAATEQIRQAEKETKDSPTVDDFLKLSVLYYNSQRYQDSVNAAQGALTLRPNMAEAYANIAAGYHMLQKDDEAIAALRQVIRLRPDMTFAKRNLEYLVDQQAEAKRR